MQRRQRKLHLAPAALHSIVCFLAGVLNNKTKK
jgi:hypothetical protein